MPPIYSADIDVSEVPEHHGHSMTCLLIYCCLLRMEGLHSFSNT
jgi:hypothetical protein